MATAALGFAPLLRPGAALHTAVVVQQLIRGGVGSAAADKAIYGRMGRGKVNLFGSRVSEITDRLFGGELSPAAILNQHTFYGVYARALAPDAAKQWADSLISGGAQSHSSYLILRRGMTKRVQPLLATRDMRSCTKCIEDDVEVQGFASWHVLHHLPSVQYCPRHGTPLRIEIEAGQSRWPLCLPQRQENGRTVEGPPASDGCSAYSSLWLDLFEARLPVVALDAWATHMDFVTSTFGSAAAAAKEIHFSMSRAWGTDADELPLLLGEQVEQNFILNELSHRSMPSRVAQRLLILTALENLGIHPGVLADNPTQSKLLFGQKTHSNRPLSLQESLRSEVLNRGCPASLTSLLMTDRTTWAIARDGDVRRLTVTRLISSLPLPLLEKLQADRSWSTNSWLSKEFAKRSGKRLN